jgi:hypothetical protein
LRELDSKTQNKIWNSLQNTVIAILEPKIYIKKLGVELTPNADFKIQYEGRELLIDKEHEDYSFIDTILQKRLTRWILEDSPLLDINFSLNEIFLLSPKEDFFNIDNFLSLISKDDSRKEVVGNGGLDRDPFLFLYDIQDKMRNSAFYI